MPVETDFFTGCCADGTASDDVTAAQKFGLCDDPYQPDKPRKRAYIDVIDNDNWIATVTNPKEFQVTFKGVDACIPILRPSLTDTPQERESRCDGILLYNDGIIFVELKERNHQWLEGGMEQLQKTIEAFVLSHGLAQYAQRRAYVANSKKPYFQKGHQRFIDKFNSDNDVVLFVQAHIDLAPLI